MFTAWRAALHILNPGLDRLAKEHEREQLLQPDTQEATEASTSKDWMGFETGTLTKIINMALTLTQAQTALDAWITADLAWLALMPGIGVASL